ncbi:magnesium/cobalt transporter CorA [Gluconobacter roseus]|uniref:Magnesium transport protein CorA n=1 Tax=Gluconobacter roseus NBRC 3990 TaxID=1307950 RepID=A0A4Y3MCG5_9PROT|nr:magnesium/cobalt transporter CorA [Gluconobacter roseus]KXV44943.1 magnesium transporter [Gluconobacter roseus]GBR46336.1 magnesium/cobalt transporter CorA [Gluconobacter roseus NBRC 3990]GEB04888.1 magnesium transport protein CorA [Gluconobacter roseus NBRC 3990]GLP94566.1 magnesium transport protein CorA [Gluconobacter roseus NBRC 3990]
MFLVRPAGAPARETGPDVDISKAVWLDLINPTPDEIARAEKALGTHVPRRDELEEIESSSRHHEEDGVLYLSTPLVRREEDTAFSLPIGFVLTDHRLVTVRYADYYGFDIVGRRQAERDPAKGDPSANELLVEIIEEVINRLADILEGLGRALDAISRRVFRADHPRDPARAGEMLRETLRRLGHAGDLASMTRDSLLGLDRILIYIGDRTEKDPQALKTRIKVAGRDIASLNDFDAQTVNKVQFLLDATLGFISIEQNDGMKVLTVVSAIGILPTLIAGIYGMNFHDMPELSWKYGYPYGLTLMALSVILPLFWFWRRGWFGAR